MEALEGLPCAGGRRDFAMLIDLRAVLCLPVALRRTTRPAYGRLHIGGRRQGCDRFLRGANAAVIGAMGGRVVVDVCRLAGEEEALFERTGQIFPCRSMPRKRMAEPPPTWVIRLQLEATALRFRNLENRLT